MVCHFWLIWSYNFRSSFCLIWIVSIYYWNNQFSIRMTSFIPCCCICSWIMLTCERKAILNISSWSVFSCSFKRYCLFGWFCHIIYDWYVDDWCISWNTIWITFIIWFNRFINYIVTPSLRLFFLNFVSSWSIRNFSFCCFFRIPRIIFISLRYWTWNHISCFIYLDNFS